MGTLRFLLTLSVISIHATPIVVSSWISGVIAVQIFFVMSGFYMGLILTEKYHDTRAFYRNRLWRILPPYLLVLAATLALSFCAGSSPIGRPDGWPIAAIDTWRAHWNSLNASSIAILGLSNLCIVGQDIAMFLEIQNGHLVWTSNFWTTSLPAWKFLFNPPAWSIALELLFYAAAPFLVRRTSTTLLLYLGATLSVRYSLSHVWGLAADPWNYRFFPSEVGTFILGILSYRGYRQIGPWVNRSVAAKTLSVLLFLGWLPLIVFCQRTLLDKQTIPLLALAATTIPFIFAVTNKSRLDHFLAEITYPVFLLHYPAILLLLQFGITEGLYVALTTMAVAVPYYLLLGRRLERYRQKGTPAGHSLQGR